MATVDRTMHTDGRDVRAAGHRHGREHLAEVIMINRPPGPSRPGLLGSLVTMARVFASPRPQATPVRRTPRPPSSPVLHSVTPDDAA
ncbi:MAG TPA: hypothetical protein VMF35_08575 [Acidimicrobiales bacterium]|nr:hypothetical protein [Acidimicrobiales bacterium]